MSHPDAYDLGEVPEETNDLHYVVCPHCRHKHTDAWEITGNDDDERETECAECGKEFVCWSETSITYSAKPKATP